MKLLKIQSALLEESSVIKLTEAREYFSLLLRLETFGEREVYVNLIEACMANASLTDWFLLYSCVIFDQTHRREFKQQGDFLDVVGSVHLIKLYHELMIQYRDINEEQQRIAKRRGTLFSKSRINLSKIDIELETLSRHTRQLERQLDLCEAETLARFLLIVKIVTSLEVLNKISPSMMLMNKTEMIRRPMAFIGSMAAIMNKLQGVDQRGITQKAILVKIDSAIECTLKLLGLDGDNKILIFLVREELFEKKYLAFIDYSGAAPRDHKLVFQLEVMDSEDPQQAKFF